MPDNTPVYNWPVPVLGDPPDISQIETLADAQETTLQNVLAIHGCLAYRSNSDGDHTIPDSTLTPVRFLSEFIDTDGYHVAGTADPTKITVPTGLGGYYAFGANVHWAAAAGGTQRGLVITKNGSTSTYYASDQQTAPSGTFSASAAPTLSCVGFALLADGDYLEAQVIQDSGSPLVVQQFNNLPNFWAFRLPTG